MKNHPTSAIILSLLLITLMTDYDAAFGEIRNGYEKDILCLRSSLKNLTTMLRDNSLSSGQRHKAKLTLDMIVNSIAYYELTENLLAQFQSISPKLYSEINTITDKEGRSVIVYVKFIPADATKVKAWGTTYINHAETDNDLYISEYGENTVSVKIWLVSKALLVLAHELGHVKYQVPNLASYVDYHKKNYKHDMTSEDGIGHRPDDPSGKSARDYEKNFRSDLDLFLDRSDQKPQNPLFLREDIRRKIVEESRTVAPLV